MASSPLKPFGSFDALDSSGSSDSSDSSASSASFKPFSNFDPAATERKICRFIQKEVQKSGANGVILGLSGGIDSALVCVLSAKALGPKGVCAVFFYAAENKDANDAVFKSDDFEDASALSSSLGISFQKINMYALSKSAQKMIAFPDNNTTSVLSGNLKSRLRMSLLYYYANQ